MTLMLVLMLVLDIGDIAIGDIGVGVDAGVVGVDVDVGVRCW